MPEISQTSANHQPSSRRTRRIVTVSGRGVRGKFPSRKSVRAAEYESRVENLALQFLEVAPSVTSIATQPRVFEYMDGPRRRRYTPDVAIEIGTANGTAYLEVKDDGAFIRSSRAADRIRAAIRYLRQRGECLYIVFRADLVANNLQLRLELLFRTRPVRTRYRADIDAALWDPENGSLPPADVQEQWEDAKRQCDDLLRRIMNRDPDDLLPASSR
ncbi:Tn7 transposase TnsA N-terminal domain-containing protein [Paraburkholderia sp. RL17-381-BIF-C]|uniref:Tn7 transposase TnsA N-terminal domain-containing protein n=1 Tax=Paraburkholderia sp. RL17-381-BIF-C TaxID=3031635 RepID=UPI0038B74F76